MKHKITPPIFCLFFLLAMFCQTHAAAAEEINSKEKVSPAVNKQVESIQEIKDNQIPAIVNGSAKPLRELDVNALRQRLKLNSLTNTSFDSKILTMGAEFNAFPTSSTINLTLRNMDVASILRIIAKEGHKNIVLDDSIKGVINAELKNVSLNEAMQMILVSQELEARVDGNTIFVASRAAMAKKGLNRKYIKAFKLNNSNAVDISRILEASIFNKGYAVNENSLKSSSKPAQNPLQPVANQQAMPVLNVNQIGNEVISQAAPVSGESSTGQTNLVATKKISGKVETLEAGANFGDAGELASKIKIQYDKATTRDIDVSNNDGGAIVIPDTRTNSVLVAGLHEDIVLAEEAISYLDKPLTQISIEVSLIELTKEDSRDLGLSVSGHAGKFTSGFNTLTGAAEAASMITGENSSAIAFNSVKSIADQIAFKLNALIQNRKARLLANPTVLALDGSESLIKITDQIVSRMTVTSVPNGPTTASPELSDIGIVLNILPKIGTGNSVTMRIRPSITTFLKEVTFGTSGYANLISTREVIIQDARVKAGETLAIAGLIKDTDIEKTGKIPFAGDLPIFGKLFRSKTLTHTKTELVILITPRIITDIANN